MKYKVVHFGENLQNSSESLKFLQLCDILYQYICAFFYGGQYYAGKLSKIMDFTCKKEMSKADLRKTAGFSSATLTKLNNNEIVALSVLIKICNVLKCDIGDVMEVNLNNIMTL